LLDARREVTGIGTTLCARPLANALRIAVLAAALCGLVLVVIVMAAQMLYKGLRGTL